MLGALGGMPGGRPYLTTLGGGCPPEAERESRAEDMGVKELIPSFSVSETGRPSDDIVAVFSSYDPGSVAGRIGLLSADLLRQPADDLLVAAPAVDPVSGT